MYLKEIEIHNYRSISKIKLKVNKGKMTVICGANNVGKTNLLRALDLFFSLDLKKFDVTRDIPYQIAEGSRGQGYKTKIIGKFCGAKEEKIIIEAQFLNRKNSSNILVLSGTKNKVVMKESEVKKFLREFKFIFIESSNVDLSKKISELVNDEVLLTVDHLRRKKTDSLKKLEEFINKSKIALNKIQDDVTDIIKEHVEGVEGINSSNWKAEIYFPEFISLRDAISDLITFTLHDTNKRNVETKGSGIQKIILLSLIKYISKNSKNVMWGIDEPEAFLQPALQKKVNSLLKEFSIEVPIIITTHSNHFIDLKDIDNTYLFEGKSELKEYARRPGAVFYKTETLINSSTGVEKVLAIKKYLGIEKNDNWEILPLNILVEGQEDKDYLTALFSFYGFDVPNVLVAGGADKIKGYLQFLSDFSEGLSFKPKIVCIVDKDPAGKQAHDSLLGVVKYSFDIHPLYIPRFDGTIGDDFERTIEDFIPVELFFDGLNKLLKKKEYELIDSIQYAKRTIVANNKRKILDIAIDLISEKNPSKDRFVVNSESVKKFICILAVQEIKAGTYKGLLNSNIKIKIFLESLLE